MSTVSGSREVVFPETVLAQKVGDEVVLLNLESGEYFGLNEAGARIWSLLQEGNDIAGVQRTLASDYDVPMERLNEDMERFLDTLQSKGLVKLVAKNA